jgi:hypothetical protein
VIASTLHFRSDHSAALELLLRLAAAAAVTAAILGLLPAVAGAAG